MIAGLEPGHHPDGVMLTRADRAIPFHPVGMTICGT